MEAPESPSALPVGLKAAAEIDGSAQLSRVYVLGPNEYPQLVPEILWLLDPEPEGYRVLVLANLLEKVEATGLCSVSSLATDIGVSSPRVYNTCFARSRQFRPRL